MKDDAPYEADQFEKFIADSKVRSELADILTDVRDDFSSSKFDIECLRAAERAATQSAATYSKQLVKLFMFVIEHKLNLTDLGVELESLFGI